LAVKPIFVAVHLANLPLFAFALEAIEEVRHFLYLIQEPLPAIREKWLPNENAIGRSKLSLLIFAESGMKH
jgi:hypothetical protein